MTSQERIQAAIRHEIPDTVPVSPRIWAFLLGYYGSSNPMAYLRAREEFDFDPICIVDTGPSNYLVQPSQGVHPFQDLDGDIRVELKVVRKGEVTEYYRKIETPAGPLTGAYLVGRSGKTYGIKPNCHHLEHMVKERDDLEKLRYVLPKPDEKQLANYFATEVMVGDQGMVFGRPHFGVDHLMVDAVGLENLLMISLDDPEYFETLLDFFMEYYRSLLKSNLEHGVKNIFEAWYNCSLSAGWSPTTYRRYFQPRIKANAELTHGYDGVFFFYDDGKMMDILPDLADAGVDVVETLSPPPMGDVNLAAAKESVGDRLCLKGNIDLINTLLMGTPELVDRKVAAAMEAAKAGSGFILSTSDSIRDETPVENVRAFFKAGRKYGKY